MVKKKSKAEKLLDSAKPVVEKSKKLYETLKGHVITNPFGATSLLFALIIILGLNFAGTCNSKYIKCNYKFDPDVQKVKEVITR